jgi:hypothetical protein
LSDHCRKQTTSNRQRNHGAIYSTIPAVILPTKTTDYVGSHDGVRRHLPTLTDEEPKPLTSILTTSSGDQFSVTSWWNNQLETGIAALADLANPSDDEIGYQGFSIHTDLASYNSRKPFKIDNGGEDKSEEYGVACFW